MWQPIARVALLTSLGFPAALAADERPTPTAAAQHILAATGVRGGLIVHLGCGDGRLTAALRASDAYVVQGLDADPGRVETARRHVQAAGVYGPVSIVPWTDARLPYVDNLVNLVVADDMGRVSREEILRVLAPGGVAYVRAGDAWQKTVKPRPAEIDEWTHFLHDAGNNAVAADRRVGPPRSMQWLAPPLWLRSHETPSGVEGAVCGGGRLFYLFDEGLIGITDQRLPERWALLCRDAFNGKLLWRRPLASWGWPQWATNVFQDRDWTEINGGRVVLPNENERRLVVDGDRLYATLDYQAPLSILDAATGATLATVAETAPVRQILAADGSVLVYSRKYASTEFAKPGGKAKPKAKGRAKADAADPGTLFALDRDGKLRWRRDAVRIADLGLAIDGGRVIVYGDGTLRALDRQTGKDLWSVPQPGPAATLVAHDGCVLLRDQIHIAVLDGLSGRILWQKELERTVGLMNDADLFVIDGVVWPGMVGCDAQQKPDHKGASVLAVGYDLRTGAERKRSFVPELLSPEHHHRCYRNKATQRYLIAGMEGAEFVDLEGTDSGQNNFVRGACRLGVMPCNGMLYVPPDQCFCQPGAKLLGFKALTAATQPPPVPDAQRLVPGPAYAPSPIPAPQSSIPSTSSADWPTFRHDPARHGTTAARVGLELHNRWQVHLGGTLTAPVAAGGQVYVADADAHTLHVRDLAGGQPRWTFTAGGRIDSPPTIDGDRVLLGSADGWVYCLRAGDGALRWKFLAAACDRRIASFDQVESTWPVHGSVLVHRGVAYVAAGRSTYLDGGIRLWALDPASGKLLHAAVLSGPFPDGKTLVREVSFFIHGANADVLVAEGDAIYMRQKRLSPELREVPSEVLSTKGESDVGPHVFSTAGLLDGAWYNRTFWMYAQRWPGFQLANQAPKSGQLLVVDDGRTYAVQPFYRRNVHSPMFFPGKEGYLLYADRNDNEPQIVGDKGAKTPVAWLPQSDYQASRGQRTLDSEAFGLDKMIGYTRSAPPLWKTFLPVRMRALVKAGDTLFAAGPPDVFDAADPYAAFEGRKGARLAAVSATDGKPLAEYPLEHPPVFDGLIATPGQLIVALEDGSLVCYASDAGRRAP